MWVLTMDRNTYCFLTMKIYSLIMILSITICALISNFVVSPTHRHEPKIKISHHPLVRECELCQICHTICEIYRDARMWIKYNGFLKNATKLRNFSITRILLFSTAQCPRCQLGIALNRARSDQSQIVGFVVWFTKRFVLMCSSQSKEEKN